MTKVIKVENLSKAYQLGDFSTGTLSRDLERFWAKMRGKEDPFLKIGETNDRTSKGNSDIVWSLKDLNFEVQQGDAVGIIGRNGAGKSTLLKILSRVTSPTTGKVKIKGRVASLLEVGTGFHPELTGRENIYLNGTILGMRKAEIKRRFDEIVDFSGVERYIDTPVKRYSSGMYVRLAFAVAAHLESEILIVDEVLAVGDAEFQKKCLGKMGDVSKGEGRTVLFVSHNIGAVQQLCNDIILLNSGSVLLKSSVSEGVKAYAQIQATNKGTQYVNNDQSAVFKELTIATNEHEIKPDFEFNEQVNIHVKLNLKQEHANAKLSVKVLDYLDRCIFNSEKGIKEVVKKNGESTVIVSIPKGLLLPSEYRVSIALHIPNVQLLEVVSNQVHFEILETGSSFYQYSGADNGCVFIDCQWTVVG